MQSPSNLDRARTSPNDDPSRQRDRERRAESSRSQPQAYVSSGTESDIEEFMRPSRRANRLPASNKEPSPDKHTRFDESSQSTSLKMLQPNQVGDLTRLSKQSPPFPSFAPAQLAWGDESATICEPPARLVSSLSWINWTLHRGSYLAKLRSRHNYCWLLSDHEHLIFLMDNYFIACRQRSLDEVPLDDRNQQVIYLPLAWFDVRAVSRLHHLRWKEVRTTLSIHSESTCIEQAAACKSRVKEWRIAAIPSRRRSGNFAELPLVSRVFRIFSASKLILPGQDKDPS